MDYADYKKIIHIDMDAFFASVEQRDDPDLRGKPVAVGGSSLRGVVAAASYEARKFGVYSAMPSGTARRKCPDLIFVKPRFEVYKDVSQDIHEIFSRYTDLIEPLSLDEAYLDVTDRLAEHQTATNLAKIIQADILAETGLTASAGVSYNKFLAKIASGLRKPYGLSVITPHDALRFIGALPVDKFHGVGPATAARMHKLEIMTGEDLRLQSLEYLAHHFGKAGRHYYDIVRGIDTRSVQPNRVRKSVGAERTFMQNIRDYDEACVALVPIIDKIWAYIEKHRRFGKTLTLKIKFADFSKITRSHTCSQRFITHQDILAEAKSLLKSAAPFPKEVRLLGLKISSFEPVSSLEQQNDMFSDHKDNSSHMLSV